MNPHKVEVKHRWGETDAYKEHARKTANYNRDQWQTVTDGLMAIFTIFAMYMKDGYTPDSNEAQALVKELQNYITANYYTCTDEILDFLGHMYVSDERFKNNIDKHAIGTAAFTSKSISIYCKK